MYLRIIINKQIVMEKIRKLRKTIGMRQKCLGEKLGLENNYCAIEKGRLIPSDIEETKKKAVRIMHPILIQKIIDKRAELEALESFALELNYYLV